MKIVQLSGLAVGVDGGFVRVRTRKLGDIIMEVVDAGVRVEAAAISLSLVAHVEDRGVVLTDAEFGGKGEALFISGANRASVGIVDAHSNCELRIGLQPTASGMEVSVDELCEDSS